MKKIRGIFLIAILLMALFTFQGGLQCGKEQAPVNLQVFNTVEHLLKGDLWEYIKLVDLKKIIGDRKIIGLGTTNRAHNGEIVLMNEGGKNNCYLLNPDNKCTYEILPWGNEQLPFCAVALIDSSKGFEFKNIKGEIHQELARLCKKEKIKLAAIRISGNFDNITVFVANSISKTSTKTGTPNINFSYFTFKEQMIWQMVGFYAASEDMQDILTGKDNDIHLHGVQLDSEFGGHIDEAHSLSSTAYVYPVESYQIYQADLRVDNLKKLSPDKIIFDVLNDGKLDVKNLKVAIGFDSKTITKQIDELKKSGKKELIIENKDLEKAKKISIMVDPDHEILESNENNNTKEISVL